MTVEQQILQAVLYADMFAYPLTQRELFRWLPTGKKISHIRFQKALKALENTSSVQFAAPFVLLPGREKLLGIHARRLMVSQKKWVIAIKTAKFLRFIPTVQFVGVTGSLSVNNAEDQDDIDFCIISSKRTVWITRFLATVMVELVAHRRHPRDIEVKDKICLNMFLAEDAILLDRSYRDVYIAHELLQMVPLWERKGMEKRLLRTNQWIRMLYRHAYDERMQMQIRRVTRRPSWERLLSYIERPMRWLQLWYMQGKRTTETMDARTIRFHPMDIRRKIIATYLSRLKSYKIPLDNR